MKERTFSIIGLGARGLNAYAVYALDNPEMRIVAGADPREERRELFMKRYRVPSEKVFTSADELLSQPKLSDAVIIATPDRNHYETCLKAIERGYDILLEKPISPKKEELLDIKRRADLRGTKVIVCHVLRYTPFFMKLNELVKGGRIGRLMSIEATEHVGYWHFAHSFVRGNWRNSGLSSPMILQKSCHDMDILRWLADSPAKSVSSFGSLSYFREENAPIDSAEQCLYCRAAGSCPFDARKIYIENERTGIRKYPDGRWPSNVVVSEPTEENLLEALVDSPYGHCVYKMDNDVVDHQVCSIEFENGVTASFNMIGFTDDCYRTISVYGTEGQIDGNFEKKEIILKRFGEKPEVISTAVTASGHGGGDEGIMRSFIAYLNGTEAPRSSLAESIDSHLMALGCEESRLTGKTVTIEHEEERFDQAYDPDDEIVYQWPGRAEGMDDLEMGFLTGESC